MPKTETYLAQLRNKIWTRSVPEPNSGCWLWLGPSGEKNLRYGSISVRNKNMNVHRASYIAHVGDPGQLHVLHRCDTPICVNPDHLFLGTPQDNATDCSQKGRTGARGHPRLAQETEDAVLASRRAGAGYKKLARMHRITIATARRVVAREGKKRQHP